MEELGMPQEKSVMESPALVDKTGDSSQAVRFFESAVALHRLAHAYLLVGKDEGAKMALAMGLAKAGNCQGDHVPGKSCGTCLSCREIDAARSPNIRIFGESGGLNIDTVDQFISYASLKTAAGHLKVSIFRGVDFFTDVAADRVLRTIEEPVPGNIFLLFSQNSRRVLPTIRSRVQIIKVEQRGEEGADNGGEASVLGEDSRLESLLGFTRAELSLSDTVSRLLRSKGQNAPREGAMAGLQAITLFMDSVLRARGKVPPLAGVPLAIEPDLARVNFVVDESQISHFLDRLGERFKHVEQNVNPELVLTNALLQLRRMITHE